MISQIDFSGIPPFGTTASKMIRLKKINTVYGPNGSGKTSMSRVFDGLTTSNTERVNWFPDDPIELIVFNRDFIRRNFSAKNPLKGVFTLGEGQIEVQDSITKIQNELKALRISWDEHNYLLYGKDGMGGKHKEMENLLAFSEEKFYRAKRLFQDDFSLAFKKYQRSKKKFMEKILQESASNNSVLNSREYLTNQAMSLSKEGLSKIDEISPSNFKGIVEAEKSLMLIEAVSFNPDNDFSAIVDKGVSPEWVRDGLELLTKGDDICPFCQQTVKPEFRTKLSGFFDPAYKNKIGQIETLVKSYKDNTSSILNILKNVSFSLVNHFDSTTFFQKIGLLEEITTVNMSFLEDYLRNPQVKPGLVSVLPIINDIEREIIRANEEIARNNLIYKNRQSYEEELSSQIWRFVLDWLKMDLAHYQEQSRKLRIEISTLESRISTLNQEISQMSSMLHALEMQVVNTLSSVEAINNLLDRFGFHGFSLARSADGVNYRIVRFDGSDALITLSEGEGRLLSFLYFYFLLQGSQSKLSVTNDKIVVIDDPISGLDNQAKFMVSSLIRYLMHDILNATTNIKQLFVFSHDIAFLDSIHAGNMSDPQPLELDFTFWKLTKTNGLTEIHRTSRLVAHDPIAFLWEKIRKPSKDDPLIKIGLIQITQAYFLRDQRRIPESVIAEFDEFDRKICLELCGWMDRDTHLSSGSKFTNLDLHQDASIDRYFYVFEQLFKKSGNEDYYQLMMKGE